MSIAVIGAVVGLVIAAADYAALTLLAGRVELDETKRALRITGLVQFVFLPILGWIIAPYVIGE